MGAQRCFHVSTSATSLLFKYDRIDSEFINDRIHGFLVKLKLNRNLLCGINAKRRGEVFFGYIVGDARVFVAGSSDT